MKRSVTKELAGVLKKKKADYISFGKLYVTLPAALSMQLGLTSGSNGTQIAKILSPHLGDDLAIRNGARSKYLAFKLPDEILLSRIVKKNNGKIPRMDWIPFKKDEFFGILNRLIEQGAIRHKYVKKQNSYVPILALVEGPRLSKNANVSEEKFKTAYQELERGKFYVRICDIRRYLNWTVLEFDAMLTGLRDSGKIQLETGDTDFFTKEDICESFVDENGFRRLTMVWRR